MINHNLEILAPNGGQTLIQIARLSLEKFVRQRIRYRPDLKKLPSELCQPGAIFVTLTNEGKLRGCLGNTETHKSLAEGVAQYTVAAASRDPRFTPVTVDELAHIDLEVTVLTPSKLLPYADYDDLLRQIRPGVDGISLKWGTHRGVLLPQMWQRIPDPAHFLRAICHKAAIPLDVWHHSPPSVMAYTFQVQHFQE